MKDQRWKTYSLYNFFYIFRYVDSEDDYRGSEDGRGEGRGEDGRSQRREGSHQLFLTLILIP